ncbi:MAG: TonB-dependent receptor [bacterium]|nr:TonB-dependent receptor [bacterium]
MTRFTTYLFLSFALLFYNNAKAQIDDTAVLQLVVFTGEIAPTTSSKTVQNVKIITFKNIERQGAINLRDVLIKELNIRIDNDNILGSSMSLQGISGQNIKILLDGVPMIGRENGNIDLSQINLTNIDRIEIIEGPLSVIYGTDALGGVINLISKKVLLSKEKQSQLSGNTYYESIGQYNIGGGGVVNVNKLMDFSANVNRNFFAGYNPDKNSRTMLWKPKQQVFGNFSILNEKGKLRIRFKTDIFNEKIENKGEPVINHVEAYAKDQYYITNRMISSLSLDYKRDSNTYENLLTSFSFYSRDMITYLKDLVDPGLPPTLVDNKESQSRNYFLNFMTRGSYNKQYNKNFNYQYGFDINLNSAFGTRIENDKGKMNDYAAFACVEIKHLKNFNIKPGVRATYNSRYPAPFIPSIQVQYAGVKNLTVRYSYGKGFRAPSLKELYLNFVDYNHNIQGNTELKSEISNNHNFTLRYKIKLNRRAQIFLDNGNFYNHIYNQISLVSLNANINEYTYMNIDNFKSIGTNFNASLQYKNLNISSGFALTGIYNNAFKYVNEYKYNYSPEIRSQVSYGIGKKNIKSRTTLSLFYKYNGKRIGYSLSDTRAVVQTKIMDYSMLDFTINQPLYKKKFNLTVGCKNIFNVTNINSTGSLTFHSSGSNSMPVSIGRSLFFQLNFIL